LRTTNYTYLGVNSINGVDYESPTIHVLNRKLTEVIDVGSTQIANTAYEYDSFQGGMVASSATQHGYSVAASLILNGPPAYSNGYTSSYTTRGDLTATTRWLNSPSGSIVSRNYKFDDAGNVLVVHDPLNHATTYSFSDMWANNSCSVANGDAYVTSVTNAASQSASFTYNSCVGTTASVNDVNSRTTTLSYDLMDRRVKSVLQGSESFCLQYSDAQNSVCPTVSASQLPINIISTQAITSSLNKTGTLVLDGLSRELQTQLNSDPSGVDYTDKSYDGLGHVATTSNPYRTTGQIVISTEGTSTTTYDALGRAITITKPDGSVAQIAYCGNGTLSTDEAGHWRRNVTDGLGRLIEVDEPSSPSSSGSACAGAFGPAWVTSYAYDALGDLTSVSQGGSRSRTFIYDSLGRLTSATNPETGTSTYTYDADSDVSTRLDARGITTTYSWDALNRETGETYSNGDPTLTFAYDQSSCLAAGTCYNVGRRTGMTDVGGGTSWAYDQMGNVILQQRDTYGLTGKTVYVRNLNGSVSTLTDPSGSKLAYYYNTAAQPAAVSDVTNGITYASNASYTPSGSLMTLSLGTLYNSTWIYNSRLQPCWMFTTVSSNSALPYNAACTQSNTTGTIIDLKYNFGLGTNDNGNVLGVTNDRDSTRSASFTYDQVNRVLTAQTPGSCGSNCWSQAFSYDQWGNLLGVSATGLAPSLSTQTFNTNNQLDTTASFSYDGAGNETADATTAYAWYASGLLKSAFGTTYYYDGNGDRVRKSTGKIYWNDPDGEDLADSVNSATPEIEYVYFNGVRIAHRVISGNSVYFYTQDMLGSSHEMMNTGSAPCSDSDYFPFGAEHDFVTTCLPTYRFIGKDRDQESSWANDYFEARYYSNVLGRFISPDWSDHPSPVPYATFSDPQTLNLYAYMRNNPVSGADANGHCGGFLDVGCWVDLAMEVINGIQRDGGVKPYLKNVGTGIAKGTGAVAVHTGRMLAAGPDGFKQAAAALTPLPASLEPSNLTQAEASTVTQITLPAVVALATAPIGGAIAATEIAQPAEAMEAFVTMGPPVPVADGETTVFHYGYAEQAGNFAGGMNPGSYATNNPNLTGFEAKNLLALPHDTPPNAVYPVTPTAGTQMVGPNTVAAGPGGAGGGQEFYFPQGTGANTVGPPVPILP
jgi:RHS repeat-associated protein